MIGDILQPTHLIFVLVVALLVLGPKRLPEVGTAAALEKAGDLRTYEAGLRANPDIRVIVNRNDFLLPEKDMDWLQKTFTAEQLTIFEQGGHLGNLFNPAVQKTILAALTPMRPPDPRPEAPLKDLHP